MKKILVVSLLLIALFVAGCNKEVVEQPTTNDCPATCQATPAHCERVVGICEDKLKLCQDMKTVVRSDNNG